MDSPLPPDQLRRIEQAAAATLQFVGKVVSHYFGMDEAVRTHREFITSPALTDTVETNVAKMIRISNG